MPHQARTSPHPVLRVGLPGAGHAGGLPADHRAPPVLRTDPGLSDRGPGDLAVPPVRADGQRC